MREADLYCPNFEDHTPSPEGYIQWHAWAEFMSKTHRQRKCAGCGRYSIWEPRARDSGSKPVRAETGTGSVHESHGAEGNRPKGCAQTHPHVAPHTTETLP